MVSVELDVSVLSHQTTKTPQRNSAQTRHQSQHPSSGVQIPRSYQHFVTRMAPLEYLQKQHRRYLFVIKGVGAVK